MEKIASQEANNFEKIRERKYYTDKIMGQKTNVGYLRKTCTIKGNPQDIER